MKEILFYMFFVACPLEGYFADHCLVGWDERSPHVRSICESRISQIEEGFYSVPSKGIFRFQGWCTDKSDFIIPKEIWDAVSPWGKLILKFHYPDQIPTPS